MQPSFRAAIGWVGVSRGLPEIFGRPYFFLLYHKKRKKYIFKMHFFLDIYTVFLRQTSIGDTGVMPDMPDHNEAARVLMCRRHAS